MRDRLKDVKWLVFLVLTVLVLSIVIFRQYVIDGYYLCSTGLWSDLIRANLPAYNQLYDSIAEGGNLWSWKMGIGTSMFSHADAYFDPFTYIVFIFGKEYIPHMMVWMLIIKLFFESLSMSAYLTYFKLDHRAVFLASVIYAFSGYSLIVGNNLALGTVLVYAPIVFLGIEKWLDIGRIRTLAVSLFLTCIYSYYFFYVLGIILILYVFVRTRQRKINPVPKLAVLAGVALLVMLMSSFALLPQLDLVLSSDRVKEGKDVAFGFELWIPQFKVLATAVIRSISGDLLGNPVTGQYHGYAYFANADYFQVSCFTTSFLLILAMQYWENEKEKRKNLLIVTGIACALILFPIVSFGLNSFATVNARWMFAITMLECILAGFSIDSVIKHGGLRGKSLFAGIAGSIVVILCGIAVLSLGTEGFGGQFFSYICNGRRFILALLLEYGVLTGIYVMQRFPAGVLKRWGIYLLTASALLIDEGVNYYHCYGTKEAVSEYSEENRGSYQDTSADLISWIREEDDSFYRMNKTFDSVVDWNDIPSQNDAMVQNYYGLKSYNSLNNAEYIEFLQTLGIYVTVPTLVSHFASQGITPKELDGQNLNYINGVGSRYQLISYLGVKYYITDNPYLSLPENFCLLKRRNKICVYENTSYYPLAFINEKTMSLRQFEKLKDREKDYALLEYTIVDECENTDVQLTKDADKRKEMAENKRKAFQLDYFSQDRIRFSIDAAEGAQYLSFSIPYTKDWHVYVDGIKVQTYKVNVALLGAEITKGQHDVELRYEPKSVKYGLLLTGAGWILFILLWKKSERVVMRIESVAETVMKTCRKICGNERVKRFGIQFLKAAGYFSTAFSIAAVSIFVLFPSVCLKKQFEIQHYFILGALFVLAAAVLLYIKNRNQMSFHADRGLQNRENRESNIELCRIVCMLLIIAHHCVTHGGAVEMYGMPGNKIYALFFVPCGKICFDCFLAISCWYLVDQRFLAEKFLKLWTQVLFYSVTFAVVAFGFGSSLDFCDWMSVLLPMNGNSHGFAAAYLAFYLLLPFLTLLSENLNKKQARWLLVLLLYFETGSQIIGWFSSYRQSFSSELLLFVMFYVLALNLKRWPFKICESSKIMFGIFSSIWIGMWMAHFLYAQNSEHIVLRFIMDTMRDESSIVNMIGGTALFFFFKNLKIKKNDVINYLAAGTFGILLMHDHNFFRTVLWENILHTQDWYYASWFPAAVAAVVVWVYAVGFLIERVRMRLAVWKIGVKNGR